MTNQPQETRLARGVIIFIAVIVGLNLLILGVQAITGDGTVTGPAGSSYVTGPFGTAGVYELYDRVGLEPERLTTGMTQRTLDPATVLFILEPGFIQVADTERLALEGFLQEGGRLILSGAFAPELVADVFEDFPNWGFTEVSDTAVPVFPGVPAPGISSIGGSTFGGWEDPESLLPLMVDETGTAVVLEGRVGQGSVVWLSEVDFLTNRQLANADNAAFAIAITAGRSPVFNEVIHGASEEASILPDRWRAAFWLAVGAVLAALIAYGYRAGPPEEVERRLDPERVGYVESVAGIIARTGDNRRALQPIRSTARRLLIGRGRGAGDRISNERLIELATRHGLTREEAALLVEEGETSDPMEVAAAFATLQRRIKERL